MFALIQWVKGKKTNVVSVDKLIDSQLENTETQVKWGKSQYLATIKKINRKYLIIIIITLLILIIIHVYIFSLLIRR